MDHNLSPDQKAEIQKILKFVKNMEGIIRTSPSAEQKSRVQKEMGRYRERIGQIVGRYDASRKSADEIANDLGLGGGAQLEVERRGGSDFPVLEKYTVQKASPNSSDPDVNFLSTALKVLQKEYWPVISDQHAKLDFSNGQERDSIRNQLDNVIRNMGVLTETIEEYSTAEKQDFREQLLKMKNRQTRSFIFEANEMLRKLREYLAKIVGDMQSGGGSVINRNEGLKFNARYEEATMLEGRTIAEGLVEFHQFVDEAIQFLKLPQMKITRPGS